MTNLEIDKFIKKYGGKDIDFFIDKRKNGSELASACCFGKDVKTNKYVYVIILKKDIFRDKQLPIPFLKALILHEIGHIKKGHFHHKIKKSTAEFEAQLWALTKAIKCNLNLVKCYLIDIFMGWKDFIKHKRCLRYYYNAYRRFYKIIGKKDIQKWRKAINEISKNNP